MLPTDTKLSNWLNPEILAALHENNLDQFKMESPFPHFAISRFLKEEVFEALRSSYEKSPGELILHPSNYGYKSFADPSLIRFLFGREWLAFIKRLTGFDSRLCKSYPLPQIYLHPAGSSGLGLHTDFGSERDLAIFFYLNKDWQPGMGGELGLYELIDKKFIKITEIEPWPNTFVALPIFEDSWHCVAPTQGNWERLTLIHDYAIWKGPETI